MGKVVEKKEGLLKNLFYVMNDHVPQLDHIHNDHEHDVNALKHQVFVASRTTINEQEYRYDEKGEKRHVKEVY